ncbi:hypothetical protein [Nonomuraea sp. 10N515B]|uniref:hypothetical protein n=1 Tax=Nonomuraea sp. 10N515B TaxID=3457422 RepID=UPI003FCCB5E5
MAATARCKIRRHIRLAVIGAVVFTALAVGTVGASATTPMGASAAGLTRLGVGSTLSLIPSVRPGAGPRSPMPGFLLDRGRYTTFDPPETGVRLFPAGINNRGQITGEYLGPGNESGFLRDRRGKVTKVDLSGATATEVVKINDRGVITGAYSRTVPFLSDPNGMAHGFLLDRGKVTRIDVPGAVQTEAAGINDRRQVVGVFTDAGDTSHGFLWNKGRFTTIDVPGAAYTEPIDVNDRGQIVGIYGEGPGTGPIHGFLWDKGRYTTIDVPGVPITIPFGINDHGQIVGSTLTDAATLAGARGFLLRNGVDGPVTPISFPGAPRTLATGINDRGQIVGAYENPNTAPSP